MIKDMEYISLGMHAIGSGMGRDPVIMWLRVRGTSDTGSLSNVPFQSPGGRRIRALIWNHLDGPSWLLSPSVQRETLLTVAAAEMWRARRYIWGVREGKGD